MLVYVYGGLGVVDMIGMMMSICEGDGIQEVGESVVAWAGE